MTFHAVARTDFLELRLLLKADGLAHPAAVGEAADLFGVDGVLGEMLNLV